MKQLWIIAGVALLVAVDLVLVVAAIRHTSGSGVDAAPSGTSSPAASASEEASAPETTRAEDSSDEGSARGTILTAASDGLVAWAAAAPCPTDGEDPAPLFLATDSGRTAQKITVDGMTAVRGITVADESTATVVGADASCELAQWRTTDAGESWEQVEVDSWALPAELPEGADGASVHAPGGEVTTPCAPQRVFPFADQIARVQCRNGRLLGTWGSGVQWNQAGRPQFANAIAYESPALGLAAVDNRNCDVGMRRTTDGGTSWNLPFCVIEEVELSGGDWGVAADGSTMVVLPDGADGPRWWSNDGGLSFSRAG